MCEKNSNNALSDDELWNKAGTGQTITRDDMGLTPVNNQDGLDILTEGFDYKGFLSINEDDERK